MLRRALLKKSRLKLEGPSLACYPVLPLPMMVRDSAQPRPRGVLTPLSLTSVCDRLAMWILLVLVALLVVGVLLYNGLVRMREQADASWSDIDVQLKRRYDLIPNLVETVKGYATHEQGTLERVIQARNAAMSAEGPGKQGPAENMLTGTLRSLFALAEAYPDLKADKNFGQLQDTLADLEDQIQRARRYYNAVVRDYNTRTQQIPTNLIATAFGFHAREFFEIDDEEKAAPEVRFTSEDSADD